MLSLWLFDICCMFTKFTERGLYSWDYMRSIKPASKYSSKIWFSL